MLCIPRTAAGSFSTETTDSQPRLKNSSAIMPVPANNSKTANPSISKRERNTLNKLSRPKSVVGLPLNDFDTLGRRPLYDPPVMRMAAFVLMLTHAEGEKGHAPTPPQVLLPPPVRKIG